MVPRVDVVTVRADDPADRVVELLDTGHTRFPVIGDGVDDVRRGGRRSPTWSTCEPADRGATYRSASLAAPPVLVPESLPLPAVLERLRAEHRQLACVVDEYGGFAGVITLEDIAEELVGADPRRGRPARAGRRSARPTARGWCPAAGGSTRSADATGVALPEGDDYDTVSGLVLRGWAGCPAAATRSVVELPPRLDARRRPGAAGPRPADGSRRCAGTCPRRCARASTTVRRARRRVG